MPRRCSPVAVRTFAGAVSLHSRSTMRAGAAQSGGLRPGDSGCQVFSATSMQPRTRVSCVQNECRRHSCKRARVHVNKDERRIVTMRKKPEGNTNGSMIGTGEKNGQGLARINYLLRSFVLSFYSLRVPSPAAPRAPPLDFARDLPPPDRPPPWGSRGCGRSPGTGSGSDRRRRSADRRTPKSDPSAPFYI